MVHKKSLRTAATDMLLYAAASGISMAASKSLSLDMVFWMPSAVLFFLAIKRGISALFPYFILALLVVGGVQLQLLDLPRHIVILGRTTLVDTLFALTVPTVYHRLRIFRSESRDLQLFAVALIVLSILQGISYSLLTGLLTHSPHTNLLATAECAIPALLVSNLTLLPFLLLHGVFTTSYSSDMLKPYLNTALLLLLIVIPPFFGRIFYNTEANLMPFHILFIGLFLFFALKSRLIISTGLVLIFSFWQTIESSGARIIFLPHPFPFNVYNAQYSSAAVALLIILVKAILIQREKALETAHQSYHNVKKQIKRQTETLQKLNLKLISEIEERTRIEQELRLSRKLLQESQEISKTASWEYTLKNKSIRWSQSATKLLGIEQTEIGTLTLDHYIRMLHPEDRKKLLNELSKASERAFNIHINLRLKVHDEEKVFYVIGKSFEENGRVERIVGVIADITDRRHFESKINEKESRYRALFHSNIDAIALIDGDEKTIIDINAAFEEKYGWQRDEIIGKPFTTLASDSIETIRSINIALQKGFYRVPSRIHIKKNGDEFYVEEHFVGFTSDDKQQIFALLQDITPRKTDEIKLAEREMKLRLFYESDFIGMAETTTFKSFITSNKKLTEILGYKPDELSKLTWDSITHPDDLAAEEQLFNDILKRKRESYSLEKRFITKNQTVIYCNVSVKAIKTPQGAISHFVTLVEDITPKKTAQQKLIDSQRKLQKAQELADLGICIWPVHWKYINFSDEAIALLGLNGKEAPFPKDLFFRLLYPKDLEHFRNALKQIINGDKREEILEVKIMKPKKKSAAYLRMNIGISHTRKGKPSELILSFADITTSKLAELSLREANTMKDQLFAVIAHDLRGPIGNMQQLSRMLSEQWDETPDSGKQEMTEMLSKTAGETYELLNNLLSWAQSQRQHQSHPKIIAVKPVVEKVGNLVSSMLANKQLSLTLSIPSACKVFIDPDMLNTILRNLISNAIKFTPNGGKITIEAHNEQRSCIVSITDTGIGIPNDKLPLLFAENKTYSTFGTNNESGTGLGLKLVQRFVERNDGEITVESQPGKGSRFTLTLPAG